MNKWQKQGTAFLASCSTVQQIMRRHNVPQSTVYHALRTGAVDYIQFGGTKLVSSESAAAHFGKTDT